MKIYYVRHGQTDWNLERKMQGGQTEKELNETGIKQAEETRDKLSNIKYDLVICSPMNRAKHTARIITEGKDVKIIEDERIRERKLGELEGHPITPECEKEIWNYKLNTEIKNGESLEIFENRVIDFINDIRKKYKDKTILIVAHGGVAKIFKSFLYGRPEDDNLDNYGMKNCEIIEAEL